MRIISVKVFALINVLVFAGSVRGQAPTSAFPPNLILERFAVLTDGDCLLVPVRVAEKEYLFVVDTGATGTVFDSSFSLGQPIDVVTMNGAEGQIEINLYHPPEAKVGRISLGPLDAVAGMDLKSVRQVAGHQVYGILGMDFLGRYVVHIDITNGELLILKAAPVNAGAGLPISWDPGDYPLITAEIAPRERIRFLVDTGSRSVHTGSLGIVETRSLVNEGVFREIGKTLKVSISGKTSHPLFQGRTLNLGDFAVHSPIFGESRGSIPNVLGLRFWSRFGATFDFPGRRVYLRKSANFDRPDRWNATGLHLLRIGDSIEVAAVDTDSPAARAGLKKGDIIIELDGILASKARLFALFQALCKDSELTCVVRRDTQQRRLTIRQNR
jgi:Aspartyl protease/PDZ domain